MGSREKVHTTTHQPLLSSLVVRPTDSGGAGGGAGGGGGAATGAAAAASDYEPGEVRQDAPPTYSRYDRVPDERGYRMRAGSVSPARHRPDNRYSPGFDHSGAPPRSRGYGSGRDHGRYRDYSPPYSARDGPGPLRGEVAPRNNPNVRQREGDWFCSDASCNNLNFARREICNNCKRPRYALARSPPRRGFPVPPPLPPRRFPAPPPNRSPGRMVNGYRSPPRGWTRDDPRDFRAGGPPYPRHEGRFPDPLLRRDGPDYAEEFRERSRFDRLVHLDWAQRDRGRDSLINERKGYERRAPSPPLSTLLPRGQWGRDIRGRSRSPVGGGAPLKDYRRVVYMERGRDDRRGLWRAAY